MKLIIKKCQLLIGSGLLLCLTMFSLNASEGEPCPCDEGTAPFQFDCDLEVEGNDSCAPCDSSCETNGISTKPNTGCCDGEEFDNSWSNNHSQSFNISALIDAINDVMSYIPGETGCRLETPSVKGGLTYRSKLKCCDNELKTIRKFGGKVQVNDAKGVCQILIPGASVPYVLETLVQATLGLNLSLSANKQTTCESDIVCFTPSVSVGFGLGGVLSVASGAIKGTISGTTVVEVSGDYCPGEGWKDIEVCIGSIQADFEVELAYGLWEHNYNVELYEGWCES